VAHGQVRKRKRKVSAAQAALNAERVARTDVYLAELRSYQKQSRFLTARDDDKVFPAGGAYDGQRYYWSERIVGEARPTDRPVIYREHTDPFRSPGKLADPEVASRQAAKVQAHAFSDEFEPSLGCGMWYLPKQDPYECWTCGRTIQYTDQFFTQEHDGATLCVGCAPI